MSCEELRRNQAKVVSEAALAPTLELAQVVRRR